MSKDKRSADELAEMVRHAMGAPEIVVGVRRDHAFGWQPMIFAAPPAMMTLQRRAEEIAKALRPRFDLRE